VDQQDWRRTCGGSLGSRPGRLLIEPHGQCPRVRRILGRPEHDRDTTFRITGQNGCASRADRPGEQGQDVCQSLFGRRVCNDDVEGGAQQSGVLGRNSIG